MQKIIISKSKSHEAVAVLESPMLAFLDIA